MATDSTALQNTKNGLVWFGVALAWFGLGWAWVGGFRNSHICRFAGVGALLLGCRHLFVGVRVCIRRCQASCRRGCICASGPSMLAPPPPPLTNRTESFCRPGPNRTEPICDMELNRADPICDLEPNRIETLCDLESHRTDWIHNWAGVEPHRIEISRI